MSVWGYLLALPLAVLLLNRGIRLSLRAARVAREGKPEGLPWQTVDVPTCNGKQLRAWFIPAGPKAVVMMHGWGGNAASLLPLAPCLHGAGYSLLLLDARCHGESDDDSFASLPRFAEDIEAGIDWLVSVAGIERDALAVIGHSVGAGAALLVASRLPEIRGVVSLSAFAHPATMMRRWLAAKHIPYWPLGAYVLAYIQKVIGHRFDDIAPTTTIAQVRCPVLLVHGRDDAMVPLTEAREIRGAAAHDDVELMEVAGNHEDFGDVDGHMPKLLGFLERAFARPDRQAEEREASTLNRPDCLAQARAALRIAQA